MYLDKKQIDLNCDLGEIDPSLVLENKIMPLITRCNIACGGHAGNAETMRETIFMALNHRVEIGAHPSYPDQKNFGRVRLKMSDEKLMESIYRQLSDFLDEVENCGAAMDHIKAHGALYHYLNQNEKGATSYLMLIESIAPDTKLLVPENSVMCNMIHDYPMEIIYEAFADRRYNSDKTLQSRKLPSAIISNVDEVLEQVNSIVVDGGVLVDEEFIPLKANSICVHSDTKNSLAIIKAINQHFNDAN